jgi:PAS domain S-box-containing protein
MCTILYDDIGLNEAKGAIHMPDRQDEGKADRTPSGPTTITLEHAEDVTDVTELIRAEQTLRESHTRQATILNAIPDLIFRISRAGEFLDVRASQENLLFVPREAIIGHTVSELLPPEVAQASIRAIAQALETGAPQVIEYELPLPGGQHHFEARHVVSGPDEVLCIARDITELRWAERARAEGEEALRQSEDRFRVLIEAAPVGICVMTAQGHFAAVNDAYCALTGYAREELLAGAVGDLHPPEEREAHLAQLQARFAAGSSDPVEFTLLTKQGERRTVLGRGVTVLGPSGQRQRLGFVVDISARKAMEEELRASEARFRALTEHSSDVTYIVDADGTICYASTSHETVLGHDPATVVGRSRFEFVHPADIDRARAELAAVVAEGGRRQLIKRIRHADGTYRTFETILDNQLDNPAVRGVVVNARDITERRAAEEVQARLAAIVTASSDAIIGVALDRTITTWNAGAERLYGYTAAEAIGRSIDILGEPSRLHEGLCIRNVVFRGEPVVDLETVRRHRDGRTVAVSISAWPIRDASGAVIGSASIQRDISARKAAERAVEEARAFAEAMDRVSFALAGTLEPERLHQIILEQAMAVLPCDNAVIFLYREGWALASASRGEATVQAGTRLFPIIGPFVPWLATDQTGAVYLPDTDLEPRWVNVAPWERERRIRSLISMPLRIDGEAVGAFQILSCSPQRYEARHLALAEAFGARVVQALRNAQLYVEEQQRAREAKDFAQLQSDFLGVVSHELLSPITATKGLAQLLRKQWSTLDEAHRDRILGGIAAAANRQQRLVQDLLDVSRAEAEGFHCERQPFALRPALERAATEVQDRYPGQCIDLQGLDAVVEGDAGRTQQILVNLIDNAAKYSPEGNPVTVSWGQEVGQLVVRVRDYGLGIPEAGREQLFTRFGQLAGSAARAGRGGTGLGLYLSRLLARAMGGELDLESTGPQGSTFRLLLPCAPQT